MSEPQKITSRNYRIKESQFMPAETRRVVYFAAPEAGTHPDALLDPAYWTHVARKLRPLYRIEAVCEDGSWVQELIVLHVRDNEARVARLSKVHLDVVDPDKMESDVYEVKWSGPVDKFRVMRKKDGAIIKGGFSTKVDAVAFLATLGPGKAAA